MRRRTSCRRRIEPCAMGLNNFEDSSPAVKPTVQIVPSPRVFQMASVCCGVKLSISFCATLGARLHIAASTG